MKLDVTLQDLYFLRDVLGKQMEVDEYCKKDIRKHLMLIHEINKTIRKTIKEIRLLNSKGEVATKFQVK